MSAGDVAPLPRFKALAEAGYDAGARVLRMRCRHGGMPTDGGLLQKFLNMAHTEEGSTLSDRPSCRTGPPERWS